MLGFLLVWMSTVFVLMYIRTMYNFHIVIKQLVKVLALINILADTSHRDLEQYIG